MFCCRLFDVWSFRNCTKAVIRNWKNERRFSIERHPKCHQVMCVCEYDAHGHLSSYKEDLQVYSTVKYTDDTRDSRKKTTEVEDKKSYCRIQHDQYSLDLAPFDCVLSPTEIGSAWKGVK